MKEPELIMEIEYAHAEQPEFIGSSLLSATEASSDIEAEYERIFGTHLREALGIIKDWIG